MRYSDNIEILKGLKNGNVSEEVLKNYSGWGGLREAVYTPEIYKQMKRVLTDDEILSIKKTLSSAYYTPREIISFMCKALGKMGYRGGRVLEPSAGIGSFLDEINVLEPKEVVAVEMDTVSCKILQKLHPDVTAVNAPFQESDLGKFDLIIGNPPFGKDLVEDAKNPDLANLAIHHYFAAKCVRMLNPDGILAMVLPSYFMDNRRDHARDIIAKDGGSLIAAFRLPDDLFADAKVTVDIVFIRKGKTANNWRKVRFTDVTGGRMPVNEYFLEHKDHVLGRLEVAEMYNRKGLTCKSIGDTFAALSAMLENITPKTSRSNAQINVQKLDHRIADITSKIKNLQSELQKLLATKNQVTNLQDQINSLLAEAAV
jgi:type I restriction-modification system DNA methylase subunit